MKDRNTLCLCMITKDEESFIERCIKSVEGLADEIVVTDTGSSDNTVQIAERLGAKIYHFPWDGSFANARNYALSKAQSDWLLLLDADEALDQSGFDIIREFLQTDEFDGAHLRVRNYTGTYSPENYSMHSAFRLLRNKPEYRFRGDIHEQITSGECEKISHRFTTIPAVVHHYGYLDDVVNKKQKRSRNIAILEKQLEDNPNEPFALFNMGNEQLSLNEYETALQYYEKSLNHMEFRKYAFVPHMIFRIIHCYENLGKFEEALRYAQAGLNEFPSCTDYEYLRANLLLRLRRYSLAVKSLETCLSMGTPPMQYEFFGGCGTYRAACRLGDVYMELEDYKQAVKYYDITLSHKPNFYLALYRMGHAFAKLSGDKDEVRDKLLSCFANPQYAPNAILAADILIAERMYGQALSCMEGLTDADGREPDIAYIRGRALFFLNKPDEARPLLEQVVSTPGPEEIILQGTRQLSMLTLFGLGLIQNDAALLERMAEDIRKSCSKSDYEAVSLMRNVFLNTPFEDPAFEEEGKNQLETILLALDMLLRCEQFDLFEQMLRTLNYIDGKALLIRLATLYENNGFAPLAAQYALRSIKELDYIDAAGAGILFRRILT
jgi:glycosyltransferase involved in cell wall biosynthesis